jgi:hypothetical protein
MTYLYAAGETIACSQDRSGAFQFAAPANLPTVIRRPIGNRGMCMSNDRITKLPK